LRVKKENAMPGTILNYTKVYTTAQAAEILQINIQTLRKWIREGKLPASKLGSDYRITGEDIKVFLDSTKTTTPGA
jgi:excisionase family DNA binding protein